MQFFQVEGPLSRSDAYRPLGFRCRPIANVPKLSIKLRAFASQLRKCAIESVQLRGKMLDIKCDGFWGSRIIHDLRGDVTSKLIDARYTNLLWPCQPTAP